jgi:choline dehydrogenase-like flavoprotein
VTAVPGAILDLSREPPPDRLDADVVIVGSGAAGGTAAMDLAAAGRGVIVLEEGGDMTGAALTGRDGRMYDQLYMDRGGRATADMGITVLQGRVLGGGTVINACDVVPFAEGALPRWVARHGLADWTPEALAPHQRRALAELSTSQPPEEMLNRNNRLLREGAGALGWRGEVMAHNRVGCGGVGTCLIGCPMNAKRNIRFVAIPAALEKGARFLTRTRAVRIEDATAERKTVRARRLDPDGHHEREELTLRARTVILAANAVASAQLLLRSGVGNGHVGRHLSLQPQLPVVAWFPDREVRFFRGIPQSFAVTEFERPADPAHGWWGFRLESIAGTPGIVASLLPRLGPEGKTQMARYAHLAACLCLLPDEPSGRIEVEGSGRLRIRYALDDEQRARFREAARAAARAYLAAGAREVTIPSAPPVVVRAESDLGKIDALSLLPASAPILSAHQQGGVRMAPSAADGAADPEGQVYGTRGVYVFDSSLFPSSAGSHTMTPIMAASHYLAARLIAATGG